MTSTRNKNTISNYKLEELYNKNINENNLYNHSSYGRPYEEHMPSLGYISSHMSRDSLAKNPIDIESQLYGIRSTDLAYPVVKITPQFKELKFKEFFKKTEIVMPEPLAHYNKQRPFP